MIRPPGFTGAAFGTVATGDLRADSARRQAVAVELGISSHWAFVNQVHGNEVVVAVAGGQLGEADAIVCEQPGLPIAVATADCVPIIVEANTAVAVIHAGWRGAAAGVVPSAIEALRGLGAEPTRAAIGPAIGSCCYEVGPEVTDHFPHHTRSTTWGTTSVDIVGYVRDQLANLDLWSADVCTFCDQRFHSWRRNQTRQRQVAVAWLPIS